MRKRLAIALTVLGCLLLTITGSAQQVQKLQLISSYNWSESFEGFGGLSALELTDNGTGFLALSDRMLLLEGRVERAGGDIIGMTVTRAEPLKEPKSVKMRDWSRDSEGLALAANGQLFVSLEAINQVWRYGKPFGTPKPLPRHPDFKKLYRNAALEALAIDKRGQIYTVPESRPKGRPGLPIYRLNSKGWQILYYITPVDGFDPVAADFGPDGAFYLLERKFSGIGFRSQLRRFDLGNFNPEGDRLLVSSLGQFDNLEGLSVWCDDQGQTRVTMVSDDNFKFFQKSEVVEFVLTETLAKSVPSH